MFANGAVGYLTKDEVPGQLLNAVGEIAAGRKGWISTKVAERLGIPARPVGRDTMPAISRVELQILRQLLHGKTDAEIAAALEIKTGTLNEKIETLMRKLGVRSRPEAVLRAMQEDLI